MGRIEEKKKEKEEEESRDLSYYMNFLAVIGIVGILSIILYFVIFSGTGTVSEATLNLDETKVIENYDHPNLISENANQDEVVKVYYYGDKQCPHCHSFEVNHLNEFIQNEVKSGNAMLIYKNIPVVNDASEINAVALYSYWNNHPQEYWEFHQLLNNNYRQATSSDYIISMAQSNNLPVSSLRSDFNTFSYRQTFEQNVQDSREAGVGGTPTIVIENETYVSPTAEELSEAVNKASN